MARQKKTSDIHAEALQRFTNIEYVMHDEREYMMTDRRFCSISGAQWEGNLFDQFANKPRFEVNKVQLAVLRIGNEYRQNRMTVDFTPGDGGSGGEDDGPNDKMADFLDGAYRAMEHASVATEAYDCGFDEATTGGFGAIRFVTQYEDEFDPDNEYQTVRMEPIVDASRSVYFDLQSKRQDKSDARYAFIVSSMTYEAYEKEYPDGGLSTFPLDTTTTQFDWYTPDVVYIAEYFVVDKQDYKVFTFEVPDVEDSEVKYSEKDFEADPELRPKIEAGGATLTGTRTVKERVINKWVMSGSEMLSGPHRLAGKHIPIIPIYGKRQFIDNMERCSGHVRLAKDVQRLKNIQLSRLAELSIISPNEKPIFTAAQIQGHETRWANDNLNNYPYLLINATVDAAGNEINQGPAAYTKPPSLPSAMSALLQLTENDMQDLLGNQQQADKLQPNTSGEAVSLTQDRVDMQTAIYLDNMRKAVQRCGEVWFSIVQDIYVESGRKIKVVQSNGKKASVTLGKKIMDDTGEIVPELDLSKAKYEVHVEVGPSSSSKRSALVSKLVGMLAVTNDPETAQVLMSTIAANMEGEGLSDMRNYFRRKLLSMGAAEPTEAEAKMLQEQQEAEANKPPSPEDQLIVAEAEKSDVEAQKYAAEADKVVAQTANVEKDTEKTQAEIAEIMAGMDREQMVQQLEIFDRMNGEPNGRGRT